MINDIKKVLRSIVESATTLQNAAGAGRVFELYVMTGIGRELQTRGYDVWVRRSDGSRVRPADSERRFIQRGGAPAGIAPSSQGSKNASSIVFRRGHCQAWELLNGVQFQGRSRANHEIDIAIVPELVATTLRNSMNGGVPLGRPRIAIECKDVGMNGSVDEMRVFVARLYDLTLLYAHHPHLRVAEPPRAIHPNAPLDSMHRSVRTYWIENRRTLNVLARRTGFVRGAASLASYYMVKPHSGITVESLSATRLMNEVADWILTKGY